MELSLTQRSTSNLAFGKVVVAVRAERVISKTALAWALTHVVRPGDSVTLLTIFPDEKKGNSVKFFSFSTKRSTYRNSEFLVCFCCLALPVSFTHMFMR